MLNINEVLNIMMNDKLFRIKLMEEAQGQVGCLASRSINGDAETNYSDLDLARSHCGSDNVLMRLVFD